MLVTLCLVMLGTTTCIAFENVVNTVSQKLAVKESTGLATIQLRRCGNISTPLSVSYNSFSINALDYVDFIATSGRVVFNSGQSRAWVNLRILDDLTAEGDEMFFFNLLGDEAGPVGFASVEILDDDSYSPWTRWEGPCSVPCGPGVAAQARYRKCMSAILKCRLPLMETRYAYCNLGTCLPLRAVYAPQTSCWSVWGQWSTDGPCSDQCEQVWRRSRHCGCRPCGHGMDVQTKETSCWDLECFLYSNWLLLLDEIEEVFS